MTQAYVLLRGAIFASSGFNLRIADVLPEARLRKRMNAFFVTVSREGKAIATQRVLGTVETPDAPDYFIHLRPYHDPVAAQQALVLIEACLSRAAKGGINEKILIAKAWHCLIRDGVGIEFLDARAQIAALNNIYGAARVEKEMNRSGWNLRGLGAPDYDDMAAEAFA